MFLVCTIYPIPVDLLAPVSNISNIYDISNIAIISNIWNRLTRFYKSNLTEQQQSKNDSFSEIFYLLQKPGFLEQETRLGAICSTALHDYFKRIWSKHTKSMISNYRGRLFTKCSCWKCLIKFDGNYLVQVKSINEWCKMLLNHINFYKYCAVLQCNII